MADGNPTADPAALIAELILLTDNDILVRRIAAASLTLILWDHFLTFDREVKHIWVRWREWNVGTALFFINRYLSEIFVLMTVIGYNLPSNVVSPSFCRSFWRFQGSATVISISIIEIVLMARSYAIWRCSKKYLSFICGLFICEVVGYTYISARLLNSFTVLDPSVVPWLTGCHATGALPIGIYIWVTIITFEAILFLFTIGRLVKEYGDGTRIVEVITRDTVVYFVILMIIIIVNGAFQFAARKKLSQVIYGLSIATPSIACSRLLLNLREVATDNSLWSIQTISQLEWKAAPGRGSASMMAPEKSTTTTTTNHIGSSDLSSTARNTHTNTLSGTGSASHTARYTDTLEMESYPPLPNQGHIGDSPSSPTRKSNRAPGFEM